MQSTSVIIRNRQGLLYKKKCISMYCYSTKKKLVLSESSTTRCTPASTTSRRQNPSTTTTNKEEHQSAQLIRKPYESYSKSSLIRYRNKRYEVKQNSKQEGCSSSSSSSSSMKKLPYEMDDVLSIRKLSGVEEKQTSYGRAVLIPTSRDSCNKNESDAVGGRIVRNLLMVSDENSPSVFQMS